MLLSLGAIGLILGPLKVIVTCCHWRRHGSWRGGTTTCCQWPLPRQRWQWIEFQILDLDGAKFHIWKKKHKKWKREAIDGVGVVGGKEHVEASRLDRREVSEEHIDVVEQNKLCWKKGWSKKLFCLLLSNKKLFRLLKLHH